MSFLASMLRISEKNLVLEVGNMTELLLIFAKDSRIHFLMMVCAIVMMLLPSSVIKCQQDKQD
jgi:hypothetical protein